MERSMIQDLANSQMFMSRSFITTATHNSEQPYDLKKYFWLQSDLASINLPNYKKEDLSSKPQFVIVFQTIEIERLSVEIDTLRVKLKEAQRHIFNAGNYEVQIRELTEKCVSYQREREQYREQLAKMNMICQRLYDQLEEMKRRYAEVDLSLKQKYRLEKDRNEELSQEVEKWRARLVSTQNSKNRQIEDMKAMMESQRKSMIDREIRQITIKFGTERNSLENQIRKVRISIENKVSELARAENQISRLGIRIKELQQNEDLINDYQNKLVMLSQEMVRLNQMLRSRQEQIDRLKSNETNLRTSIIQNEKVVSNYNQLAQKEKDLETQIQTINRQYAVLEEENRRNSLIANKVYQFERLLDDSASQIQRLNNIIRDKFREVQKWQNDYTVLQTQYKESKNSQKKIPELENKINTLIHENDRVNNILKNRTAQIEDWKSKNSNLEKTVSNYTIIQRQNRNLQNTIGNNAGELDQKNTEIRKLKESVKEMNGLQQKLLKEEQKRFEMNKQIERLNGVVRGITTQCESLSQAIQNRDGELKNLKNLEQELKQHKRRQALITQQLDRINGVILERTQQIGKLKEQFSKMSTNMAEFKRIEAQLVQNVEQVNDLIRKLDESRKESQFFQEKMVIAEGQIRKFEGELFNSNKQKSSLNSIIQQKDRQLEQFMRELKQRDEEVRVLRQLEHKINQLQNQYQNAERQYRTEQGKAESLTKQLQKLKTQGAYSQQFLAQFMKIRKQSEQKQVEMKNLQTRFQKVEQILVAFRTAMEKQVNLVKNNKNKWVSTMNTLNELTEFMNKTLNMHRQMTRLAEQNINLESSTRLLNFQLETSANMTKSLIMSPTEFDVVTSQSQQQQQNQQQGHYQQSQNQQRLSTNENIYQNSQTNPNTNFQKRNYLDPSVKKYQF